ncbi:MAG: hypothetical protein GKR91_05965 [Pseudomonadales bacterium]|nr:hypothetical protein [Pseudomonadales bacterium]
MVDSSLNTNTTEKEVPQPQVRVGNRLIFWLLFALLMLPSTFFVLTSYQQLNSVLESVNEPISLSIEESDYLADLTTENIEASLLYRLESDVMRYRHQRTVAFISTRTWMRFMSFIFGTILVMLGAGYILGKVTGPVFSAEGEASNIRMAWSTSSPGIVLVVCGVILILILIPNFSNQRIETDDSPSYVSGLLSVSIPERQTNYEASRTDAINEIINRGSQP